MAMRTYGISGKTPPKANHNAAFLFFVSAVSITAAFTKPSISEPYALSNAANKKAISTFKVPKVV
jgi:hypothetical protein